MSSDTNDFPKTDPDRIAGRKRDGEVRITLSEDELTAFADFYPPLGAGHPLELSNLEHIIEANGITYGIDWNAVKEALLTCNTEHKVLEEVVIARGKKPEPSIPKYIKLKERLFHHKQPYDPDAPQIDFKSLTPYIIVKKGEVLGREIEAESGKEGITVKNEPIAPGKRQVVPFTPGEHVTVEDGVIKAAVEGRFEKKNNTISVARVLDVEGGVDYHTGNIIFPGDVIITGEIKDGFKVYAGGSVICKDTLDASDVVSKQDLVVSAGIIGKNKGLLRVGGSIEAKYIENCRVKARGDLNISDAIVNSHIKTTGNVNMGERGTIVGGDISAIQGIRAFRVGKEAGPCTTLQCGIDFIAQKKLDQVKKKHTALYLKLQTVEKLLKKEDKQELKLVKEKITKALSRLSSHMSKLLESIHKNETAEIVVVDAVYPGTTLEICNFHFIVHSTMKHVRFYLDKQQGKIIFEELGKKK